MLPNWPTTLNQTGLSCSAGRNEVAWGLADTWAYDYNTNTWTEMAKGPAKHLGARLAYDAESDRIILFGGYDMAEFYYNDTWAYDFNSDTWTEMKPSTSPPGRNYQAMAYDAESDRVLTWGGMDLDEKLIDPSVWSYDFNTNTWQEMKPGEGHILKAPITPPWSTMPRLTGRSCSAAFIQGDETWAYDYNTNTWTKLEPSTVPGKLSRHAMVYSTAADRVILFGGQVGLTQLQLHRGDLDLRSQHQHVDKRDTASLDTVDGFCGGKEGVHERV